MKAVLNFEIYLYFYFQKKCHFTIAVLGHRAVLHICAKKDHIIPSKLGFLE